ncbi:MAG: SH3 domain-containing protein [Oscillatoriales cyanobacterium RM2_1_1]|nr:SH3 domain-containing protein [Oscillatoriales cyanobacterium SM2_3_0]NJO45140.1 SH3 domain-containing protein [Oscillatoriales cyanobacterium RM2_1_1]
MLLTVPFGTELGAAIALDQPSSSSAQPITQAQPEAQEKPEATTEETPEAQPEEKPEATTEEKPKDSSEETPQTDTEKPQPATQQAPQAASSLCRQVFEPRGLAVKERPTPNSPVIGGVAYNQRVMLVEGYQSIRGPEGRNWIEITAPVKGFVSNGYPGGRSNLVYCSGDTATKPPESKPPESKPPESKPPESKPPESKPPESIANLCRRIDRRAAPRGVVVRAKPSRTSEQVGGVPSGETVTLVKGYKAIPDPDNEPRNWIEITEPVAGFISTNTLIMCP